MSPPRTSSHAPMSRRRKRLPTLTFVLGALMGYSIAGSLPRLIPTTLGSLVPMFGAMAQTPGDLGGILDPIGTGRRRILVMGSDEVGANTDVMFTVQIRDGITRITQVPRDTFVHSDQLGVVKANALYALGGLDTVRREVGRLLDAPVDRYLKVDLDAVTRLAEALGGVEVDVPKRMYYVDISQDLYIDLYPGRQLLKGEELEGFLRFRHDEMGDLGRMERQQMVLAEVFRKLSHPTTLARLPALLQIAGEDVRTDLSPMELARLVSAMSHTRLRTERLPGRLYWENELSYWMPDSNLEHSNLEHVSSDISASDSTILESSTGISSELPEL